MRGMRRSRLVGLALAAAAAAGVAPALTAQTYGSLAADIDRAAAEENVRLEPLTGTAEDFSYYQQKVPGLFLFLKVTPRGQDWRTAPQNHPPLFFADESALPVGVRVLAHLAVDYLARAHQAKQSAVLRP
jgi:amidohydrolase